MNVPRRATPLKDPPLALEKQIRDEPPDTGYRFRGGLNNLIGNPPLVMRNGHPYGL